MPLLPQPLGYEPRGRGDVAQVGDETREGGEPDDQGVVAHGLGGEHAGHQGGEPDAEHRAGKQGDEREGGVLGDFLGVSHS
ncbi:hypothetical protein D3C86_1908710 [compost metagenome]